VSISLSAEQCCSSMKTRVRTCIASLKIGGFWAARGCVGRTSGVDGPGGGWIEVVNVGEGFEGAIFAMVAGFGVLMADVGTSM
jgi:hypothetical protein